MSIYEEDYIDKDGKNGIKDANTDNREANNLGIAKADRRTAVIDTDGEMNNQDTIAKKT